MALSLSMSLHLQGFGVEVKASLRAKGVCVFLYSQPMLSARHRIEIRSGVKEESVVVES